ncbi:hypothetical protein CAP35_13810 [Chitinophagaceae bacterium IBVUCB1]|nr:hypothetical protein CAP35_13810 [Chitinophagaceae bacterium IBVUCB1]
MVSIYHSKKTGAGNRLKINRIKNINTMSERGARIGRKYQAYGKETKEQDYHAIIDLIVEDAVNRTRQGIQEWRQAVDAADDPLFPQWHGLQDIYEYLSTDAHFQSVFNLIRKGAVLSKRFYIRSSETNKEDKDKTKLLEKEWFLKMVNEMLEAIARGYSLLQVARPELLTNHSIELPFDILPKRLFIPQYNYLVTQSGGHEAYSITDPAWDNSIICVKGFDRFGAMNDIVPNLIWKKNALQGWAIFSERFGIPLVQITTNKTAKGDIDKLEAMAKKMGQAARAVLPMGSTMNIIDSATKGDPYKVYQEQAKTHNEEVSKRFLGGTMISDNGSSRSQSEVHERTLDDKVSEMDFKMIEYAVNNQLLPLLRQHGLPIDETDEFVYDRTQTLALPKLFEMVDKLLERGFEVDDKWMAEKFSIPITGKAIPIGKPAEDTPIEDEPVKPVKKDKQPKGFFD